MIKYIVILSIFCVLFFCVFQNIVLGLTSKNDLMLNSRIKTLEDRVKSLEEISGSLKEASNSIEQARNHVMQNTNNSLVAISVVIALFTILSAGGVYSIGMLPRRIEENMNKEINKQVKRNEEVIKKNEEAFNIKLKELGIDQEDLKGQFLTILEKLEYHNSLFELQSWSEDLQARGITYFIKKPTKEYDPLIMLLLKKYEQSKNPILCLSSLRARIACGDQTAKATLEAVEAKLEAAAKKEEVPKS
jgi:hypothetical protein